MKHIIDINTWERKENYEFFLGFQNPTISITSEVECAGAKARAKAAGESFFLHYLYAVLRAVNEIPEFRFRIDAEGRVVYFDHVDMLTPIKVKENGRFFTIRLPWNTDFQTFYTTAKAIINDIDPNGNPYDMEKVLHFTDLYARTSPRQQLSVNERREGNTERRKISDADRHDHSSRIYRRTSSFTLL